VVKILSQDPFDLERFVQAQDLGGTYAAALGEMRRGQKTSHWMWFVFPQLAGLGESPISRRYAISSLEEARAYLAHPLLGPRLVESATLLANGGPPAEAIFGALDAQKLRSSMTLFRLAAPERIAFDAVLKRHFHGAADPVTLDLLAARQ
jgi:uncharacterized protein (DUF1810 family)